MFWPWRKGQELKPVWVKEVVFERCSVYTEYQADRPDDDVISPWPQTLESVSSAGRKLISRGSVISLATSCYATIETHKSSAQLDSTKRLKTNPAIVELSSSSSNNHSLPEVGNQKSVELCVLAVKWPADRCDSKEGHWIMSLIIHLFALLILRLY